MNIKKFSQLLTENKNELLDYDIALKQFILNHTIIEPVYIAEYGDYNLPDDRRYYGYGFKMDNGYLYLAFGGGCSGEDCNSFFIVDSTGELVAKTNR